MSQEDSKSVERDDCVVPQHAVPAEELGRYSVERDPHAERDISSYVEMEAKEESVKHVEKVKEEVVLARCTRSGTSQPTRIDGGLSLT